MYKNFIRKSAYLRLMLPALITAALIAEGLIGYNTPDYLREPEKAAPAAYAAEAPELETIEQAPKNTPRPKGTAGRLAAVKDPGDYADGSYIGRASGFGGTITVRVTIKKGRIASINVISAPGETGSYLSRAKAVIGRILNKQSTNVDAVSGATYSSNGIIKAVRDALRKAAKKGSKKKKKSSGKPSRKDNKDKDKDKEKDNKPEDVSEKIWADGTYIGEGEGYSGKLHVEVVIKDGNIYSVELIDTKDESYFMDKAKKGVLGSVITAQGTDVDTVTGATYSSNGLIEAINDALRQASEGGSQEGEDSISMTAWVCCDENEEFDDYQITVIFSSIDGEITSITGYSQTGPSGNNAYIRTAANGINRQLSAGIDAANVDAVTGATCTSTSIIEMMAGRS